MWGGGGQPHEFLTRITCYSVMEQTLPMDDTSVPIHLCGCCTMISPVYLHANPNTPQCFPGESTDACTYSMCGSVFVPTDVHIVHCDPVYVKYFNLCVKRTY